MHAFHRVLLGAAILLASLFSSCGGGGGGSGANGGGGGGNAGRISLEITDTPFDVDIISIAEISVDRVTIFREDSNENCDDDDATANHDHDDDGDHDGDHDDDDDGDDDGDCDDLTHHDDEPLVIYQGPPITIDLLALRNGVTRLLANSMLPAGEYRKMRMHVTNALLVLINGNTYTTADSTLRLQGHGTNGFKITVDPPFDVPEGGTIRALLDFDLSHSYKPHPHDDPLEADYYRLQARIRAANLNTTGAIRGTVVQDDGSGGRVPVADASVFLLPPGNTNPDDAVATTATDTSGGFEVLGLEPGSYDVLVRKNDQQELVEGVSVGVGTTTTIHVVFGGTTSTAAIHGIVSQVDGTGNLVPAADATVYVLPQGQNDPSQAIASTTSAADGTYSIGNLPAGFVNVLAVKGSLANIFFDVELISGTSVELNITIF